MVFVHGVACAAGQGAAWSATEPSACTSCAAGRAVPANVSRLYSEAGAFAAAGSGGAEPDGAGVGPCAEIPSKTAEYTLYALLLAALLLLGHAKGWWGGLWHGVFKTLNKSNFAERRKLQVKST